MRALVQSRSLTLAFLLLIVVTVACGPGCVSTPTYQTKGEVSADSDAVSGSMDSTTDSRLMRLRAERASDAFAPTFALGPGDVLEISAPDIDELKAKEVRVSPQGTIEVPVV